MFLGRKKELSIIEAAYNSKSFEFLVLYGRRRIGKTSLLKEFAKTHKTLLYSAQEKNDALNLSDFSKSVQMFFDQLRASNRCLQVHQGYTPEHMAADRKLQCALYAFQAIPAVFGREGA